MSRWLKSVNSLLEQLDGQVETAVEERVVARGGEQGMDAVDDILAKRGLAVQEENDDEDAAVADSPLEKQAGIGNDVPVEETIVSEKPAQEPSDTNDQVVSLHQAESNVQEEVYVTPRKDFSDPPTATYVEPTDEGDEDMEEVMLETVQEAAGEEASAEALESKEQGDGPSFASTTVKSDPDAEKSQTEVHQGDETSIAATKPSRPPEKQAPVIAKFAGPPSGVAQSGPSFEAEYKKALAEAREAQKESRTLRRHIVSLNSELETAEAEIQAQRTELERAAERMEKDRTRQKEEKERLVTRHAEELKALKLQHEQNINKLKGRSDQQLEDARKRMRELEERRMQEGGDWTKELEGALQREQESVRRIAMLEDEKSTLLSQVSSLQAQQAALENRLDSISQTADNAMEREREAEDRLDAALSMHARQLTQRQIREAELERTIAEIGAALVVARNKEIHRLKTATNGDVSVGSGGSDISALRTRLENSEDSVETLTAQLDLERQRLQALHQELQDMSKERTEEVSAAHARQLQNDRKIADMSVTISRLQASLRDAKRAPFDDSSDSVYSVGEDEKAMEIRTLSEQVLRQQETIGQSKSEISALKSRLKGALSRADNAEGALSSLQNVDDLYDRMESAPLSGGVNNEGRRTIRRRGGRGNSHDGGSIRSAIRLKEGQGGEKIGRAIDVVDSFSVQTGKYLRSNPLARAGFLLYLLLIHVWALALLVFHAHSYETIHGDFGAGHQLAHGPHALMQAHEPQVAKLPEGGG